MKIDHIYVNWHYAIVSLLVQKSSKQVGCNPIFGHFHYKVLDKAPKIIFQCNEGFFEANNVRQLVFFDPCHISYG